VGKWRSIGGGERGRKRCLSTRDTGKRGTGPGKTVMGQKDIGRRSRTKGVAGCDWGRGKSGNVKIDAWASPLGGTLQGGPSYAKERGGGKKNVR